MSPETPFTPETSSSYLAFIILDIDGIIGRWVQAHLPNHGDLIQFHHHLHHLQELGVGFGILTNRPAGHLPLLAYNLGIDYGYWVAESGGVIYDVTHHQAIVAPNYQPLIPQVSALRQALVDSNLVAFTPTDFGEAQFEPGGALIKTVIIPPAGTSPHTYAQDLLLPFLRDQDFIGPNRPFTVNLGKAIDIDPLGLSKAIGMATFLHQNHLDPNLTPCLWIADADRDIAAATHLHSLGGQVAAVANSSPAYLNTISTLDGFIAPEGTSYHSSVSAIFQQFMDINQLHTD